MLDSLISSAKASAAQTDFGLIFLRALFLYFLVDSWRPVFNPRIQVVSRRSRVPRSRRTVILTAVATIPMCTGVFGIRPLPSAGLAALGIVIACISALADNRDYRNRTIRFSFKPVPQDRRHPDQLWIGACVVVAAFWTLSLYLVVRDTLWPRVGPDEPILRWMARFLLAIFCVAGLVLYGQRPKKGIAAQLEKG